MNYQRSRYRAFSIAGGFALALCAPAQASVKDGVDAWSKGDYAAAVEQWQGPAKSGDADAMFNLAQAYRLGRGVEPDAAKARDLYEKAAAQGHIKAADNYGLLLFQQGDRERAMPYIRSASDRGDPRAQYVMGLAYFNGDLAEKNWVRAYALVSLAQAAGLPQAANALKQMDSYVPLEDRQRAQLEAAEIRRQSDSRRSAQLASADLGTGAEMQASAPSDAPRVPQAVASLPVPASNVAASQKPSASPAEAGADFARPKDPVLVAGAIAPAQRSAPAPAPRPAAQALRPATPATQSADGPWRVQLGAFGVQGNAQKLWNSLSGRPYFAGKKPFYEPAGKLTKLMAGGFASQGEAEKVCSSLKAAGQGCIVTR